jgi:WD40 repeat protein
VAIPPQAVIVGVLLLTTFPAKDFGQQANIPADWEVKQIAYDVPISSNEWAHNDNLYVKSGPGLKFKHLVDTALLPKWSPNGQKLAFLSPCQADLSSAGASFKCVEVANEDLSRRVRLTRHPTKVFGELMSAVNLAWSPSGDEIAYIEEGHKAWTTVSTIRSDGLGRKEIQRLECLVVRPSVDWSPDGQRLAFTGCSATGPTIMVIDRSGGDGRVIAVGVDPLWSPDGKMLLFVKVADAVGPNPLRSPDGRDRPWAQTVNPDPATFSLSLVNADGTQESKILDGERAILGLTWSPSGHSIAFSDPRDNNGLSEIFRVNLDGTDLRKVASGEREGLSFTSPVFSPDERELLVVGDSCLSCLLAAGLTELPAMAGLDGIFLDAPMPTILLMDLSTGHEQRLADGGHPDVFWVHK